MGILKDVKNTVKNIFNTDDDILFEEENDFIEKENFTLPKLPFAKKRNENDSFVNKISLPSFDADNHNFNLQQNTSLKKNKSNGRIQVYVPKSFEEAFNIIKDVKEGFTAMVNVEVANPQISQRIVDVISGAIYALDGDCKKMGEKQYIFSLSTETVGAYDYLPVNGVQGQMMNQQYFNMGQPFDFLNQNPMMQNTNFMPQNQMFNQNTNFNNNNSFINNQNVNQNLQNNQTQDFNSFYVPPQSQF